MTFLLSNHLLDLWFMLLLLSDGTSTATAAGSASTTSTAFVVPFSSGMTTTMTMTMMTRTTKMTNQKKNKHWLSNSYRTPAASSNPFLLLLASTDSSHGEGAPSDIIHQASQKLLWERLEEQQNRPILNLSEREASPEKNKRSLQQKTLSLSSTTEADETTHTDNNNNFNHNDTSHWDQGQRWIQTRQRLKELLLLNTFDDDDHHHDHDDHDNNTDSLALFLEQCPQLYRLEPSMVIETCEGLLSSELGSTTSMIRTMILKEPRLLSYRWSDVQYGITFLQQMMAPPSMIPVLLLSGIDGGIQERAVAEAMGKANDATYKANQQIAGDAVAAWKALKNNNNQIK